MADNGTSATKIWHAVCKETENKYETFGGLVVKASKAVICNVVSNTRTQNCDGDTFHQIQTQRYATVGGGDNRLFLKINFSYELTTQVVGTGYMLRRLLVWAHPDLLPILKRQGIAVFVDGTFRSVPKPFTQCIVIMAFDDEAGVYVPIIYALMDNKTQ